MGLSQLITKSTETSFVKFSSRLNPTYLEEKIEALEREGLNLKPEVVKCKLKKLISRLTRNNAELLAMASQHFKYMDCYLGKRGNTTF
jgi:hypothetical protein